METCLINSSQKYLNIFPVFLIVLNTECNCVPVMLAVPFDDHCHHELDVSIHQQCSQPSLVVHFQVEEKGRYDVTIAFHILEPRGEGATVTRSLIPPFQNFQKLVLVHFVIAYTRQRASDLCPEIRMEHIQTSSHFLQVVLQNWKLINHRVIDEICQPGLHLLDFSEGFLHQPDLALCYRPYEMRFWVEHSQWY